MHAATSDSFCWAERGKFGVVALDSDVDTTTAAGPPVATMMGGVAEW